MTKAIDELSYGNASVHLARDSSVRSRRNHEYENEGSTDQ